VPRGAELSPVQVGFSVPKKKFRHSVQRHRITRMMREAWRLNKQILYAVIPPDTQLHVFIIYTETTAPDYATLEAAMLKSIAHLQTVFKAANA
jgi:ribonuclease P protein component